MATDINKIIGANIRQRRRRRGFSQGKLGKHIGTTFQQVQKYERGINKISAEKLWTLATLFQCTVNDFFQQDGVVLAPAAPVDIYRVEALVDEFCRIASRPARDAVCAIVKLLAGSNADREAA